MKGTAVLEIRKPTVKDVPEMQQLINHFAEKDELLPRSLNDLYENIRDFVVLMDGERIIGTCALHVSWEDLAEVKALVIDEEYQGQRLGRKIVEFCIDEARALGLTKAFALTYRPGFFKALGFREVPKSELPHKVWNECIHCVKFPNCGEIAVSIDIADV